eukprot:6263322-Amphidinium_carterae.1
MGDFHRGQTNNLQEARLRAADPRYLCARDILRTSHLLRLPGMARDQWWQRGSRHAKSDFTVHPQNYPPGPKFPPKSPPQNFYSIFGGRRNLRSAWSWGLGTAVRG